MGKSRAIWVSAFVLCLLAGVALPCGPDFTFRAYLSRVFWQPFAKYEDSLVKAGVQKQKIGKVQPGSGTERLAFAGFSTAPAGEALSRVRKAYIEKSYDGARAALAAAEKAELSDKEREELRLVDAKLDLRIAEEKPSGNRALLEKARQKLEAFIKASQVSFWKSEARGWLARVNLLLGEHSRAVKIYLDEISREETAFSRESLVNSLHLVFPYNGSSARLADHLEEYFDTPSHALFVVSIVTNPVTSGGEERAAMAGVGRKVIEALQKHGELFNGTDLSDSLVLAVMRASIYMGDTRAAIAYSRKIAPASGAARTAEFNWMVAACHFLQIDYAQAETPLLKMIHSRETNPRELRAAARGLIGVYQKLRRGVDQLHAAFLYEKAGTQDPGEPSRLDQFALDLPAAWDSLLDLPYLLDVQLTDDELKEYLVRYGKEARGIRYSPHYRRARTAFDAVEYALAVRLARQERYAESAEIYERLNAWPRAGRMRILAALFARTSDTALPAEERLEARYLYASFLEEHSTQVFFNDMVWWGFQTWTFVDGDMMGTQGLTGEERDRFRKEERRVKDEQEERWRAYVILAAVVEEAGYTELGKKAATKADRCLALISRERFDRTAEIEQAREKLGRWFREYWRHGRRTGGAS
jgi:hypothetical protein